MTQETAKSYIGKTLQGYLIDDVGRDKGGWIAWFRTPEGYRWAYLTELID